MLRRVHGGVLASAMLAGSVAALRPPMARLYSNSNSNSRPAMWRAHATAVSPSSSSSWLHTRCNTTSMASSWRAYSSSSSSSIRPTSIATSTTWSCRRSAAVTALRAPMRDLMSSPTPPRRIRVHGRDDYIRPQNTPMQWGGGGGDSGGSSSQYDSLTPYVRAHLTRVYGLLMAGCCVAGVGSMLMIATPLVKVVPFWLPMLGGFVPLLWLTFAPPANPALRTGLFFSFTLLEGMALAPLILMTSMKGVLVTSIVLTAAIFGGFSAAAYLSPRASLVSWQGPLFGALIGLVAVSLLNAFYPTAIAHSLILYGGLALFSVLVAVDTQAMIERARCGAGDAVQDALQMFLNVVNIFVRIAQIMGDSGR